MKNIIILFTIVAAFGCFSHHEIKLSSNTEYQLIQNKKLNFSSKNFNELVNLDYTTFINVSGQKFNCEECDLTGVAFINCKFDSLVLNRCDITGLTLHNCEFKYLQLESSFCDLEDYERYWEKKGYKFEKSERILTKQKVIIK